MKLTDYTMEYCPWCDKEVVIHAHGVTRCPSCGAPLAPCSVCAYENGGCKKDCPYGCDGANYDGTDNDLHKPVTMPDMTTEEINWFTARY